MAPRSRGKHRTGIGGSRWGAAYSVQLRRVGARSSCHSGRGMRIAENLLESIAETGLIDRPVVEYTDEWVESPPGNVAAYVR